MEDNAEVFRYLPFPFDDDAFPQKLGALVQRSVLEGDEPAREVIHADDGSWLVGDGLNETNPPGASVVTHMSHVIDRNSSVAALADLPIGHIATRTNPGDKWLITPHRWEDEKRRTAARRSLAGRLGERITTAAMRGLPRADEWHRCLIGDAR